MASRAPAKGWSCLYWCLLLRRAPLASCGSCTYTAAFNGPDAGDATALAFYSLLPVTAFKTALPQDNYCVGFSILLKVGFSAPLQGADYVSLADGRATRRAAAAFLLNTGPRDYAYPRPPPDPRLRN